MHSFNGLQGMLHNHLHKSKNNTFHHHQGAQGQLDKCGGQRYRDPHPQYLIINARALVRRIKALLEAN